MTQITPEVLRNVAVDAIIRSLGGVSVGQSWALTSMRAHGSSAELEFTLGSIYESAPYNTREQPYDFRQRVQVAIDVITPTEPVSTFND